MEKITTKQEEILNCIHQALLTKGYPPSIREICQAIGLKSSSTVHGHLSRLEKAGYIRRDKDKPRAIEIIHPKYSTSHRQENNIVPIPMHQHEMVDIPILGKVAAGVPLLAVSNIEDYLSLPLHFLSKTNSNLFILEVKGDSMIDIGIYSGDYVIVGQQNTARDRDIVVALIDDSATVKTYYKEKDHIRLQPENSTMDPILVKDVTILGKVISLFRRFV